MKARDTSLPALATARNRSQYLGGAGLQIPHANDVLFSRAVERRRGHSKPVGRKRDGNESGFLGESRERPDAASLQRHDQDPTPIRRQDDVLRSGIDGNDRETQRVAQQDSTRFG